MREPALLHFVGFGHSTMVSGEWVGNTKDKIKANSTGPFHTGKHPKKQEASDTFAPADISNGSEGFEEASCDKRAGHLVQFCLTSYSPKVLSVIWRWLMLLTSNLISQMAINSTFVCGFFLVHGCLNAHGEPNCALRLNQTNPSQRPLEDGLPQQADLLLSLVDWQPPTGAGGLT